jgi:hypothetical protein
VARPSKLTPELRERIEQELADGAPVVVAAQRTGVSPRSLTRWLSQGLVIRPSAPDAPLGFAATPPDPAPGTGGSIEGRVADAEEGLVAVILAAARRGSWQASAWLLERSIPERWARPPARTTEAPRVPALPGVFDEVDQLAARRARRAAGVPSTET